MRLLNDYIVCQTKTDWRLWLENNHATATEVWLKIYKKHTGKQTLNFADALEEALCFGWIDSMVKSLDEESFVNRFSPRRTKSLWSEKNKLKVLKLFHEGKMTQAGIESISWLSPETEN